MTESTKDQVVLLLDTSQMRSKYRYTLKAVNRNPHLAPDNNLSWDVRIFFKVSYMRNIHILIAKLNDIKEPITVSVETYAIPYLMLL